ncbi:MAG TPA: M28 family peptidase [Candidatus Xenobia bacterium]|nr:M28 family peptidase [Candidatus Xenobia bacterium]
MKRRLAAATVLAGMTIFLLAAAPPRPRAVQRGEAAITPDLLYAHTAFLSDDLLEGRGPGGRGIQLASKYIASEFRRLGLKPVGDNGTYFQNVPLLGRKVEPKAELHVARGGDRSEFKFFDDWVPMSDAETEKVKVEGDLVFVGYGITAPENRWDDFKGVDVRNKVLLVLVNDPPAPPDEPDLFGGKALTYYGRWTYKFEEAARRGAAGAILIHTTESAGYPFQVVQSSWTTERFDLPRQPGDEPPLNLKGWVSQPVAEKILGLAKLELSELQTMAATRDFKPVALGVRVSTELEQKLRRLESPNVIGLLPGRDPKGKEEYVIYTAHHDHLGIGQPDKDGDNIYNGAADNAIGVAGLLAIAEAMVEASKTQPPRRSQVFLAVTAEEQGLLGALYYARNPVFPPAQTVANINMDGLNIIGPTTDIVQVGNGKSELDAVAQSVARERGLTLKPDQFPEKGFFYRSDQFAFAKVGIPALYFDNGLDVIGKPPGYGKEKAEEYTARDYHQPSDEIRPDWDWRGAEQMAEYLFAIGWRVANATRWYEWNPTAEFRAAREASRKKTK